MAKGRQELLVIIKAKDVFTSTAKKIVKGLGAIAKAAKWAAAGITAVTGTLIAMAVTTARAADEVGKFALRIGASTEALSELHHVAELSAVSTKTFDMALQRMTRRVAEAIAGYGEARGALEELGVTTDQLTGKRADEQFMIIAAALSDVTDQSDRLRLAFKLFDSEGTSVLQTMKDGAEGISAMREEARLLGITFTEIESQQAAAFNDELLRATSAVKGLWREIGVELIPTFTTLLEHFVTFVTKSTAVTTAIAGITDHVKSLAEALGFKAFTALEKVNQEIKFMQTAGSFAFFTEAIDHSIELNRLLVERARLTEELKEKERSSEAEVVAAAKAEAAKALLAAEKLRLEEKNAADILAFEKSEAMADETAENNAARGQAQLALEKKIAAARLSIQVGTAGAIASTAESLFAILGSKSKAALKVVKATSIANAVIKGYTAAVDAWQAGMSTGGPWAPIVAAAYTAASLAKTGALIAKIGGSQGGDVGTSPGLTPSIGQTPAAQAPASEQAVLPAPQVNITISTPTGEVPQETIDRMIDGINVAYQRNIFINNTAILGET